MSMNAIRQLNNGGLKLKTNFSAKSVAANMNANKSIFAKYSTFGSNALFTKARRMGGTPTYMNASMVSRSFNGQSMRYAGSGEMPISSARYSQNVTMGPSSAFNTGSAIGMILGAAPTVLGALDKIGVFGSKQTAGAQLSEKMQAAFGSYTPVDSGELSGAGLPTASSLGANFNSTYASVEAYMKSDTMDPQALKTSAANLVSSASNDFSNAEATFNILKGRQADAMSQQTTLQDNLSNAETDKNTAKTQVGESKSSLQSAKKNREQKDEILSAKNADYKAACTDLTAKEGVKEKAQASVSTCTQEVATAKSELTQATANREAAENALNSASTAEEKAAAQAALDRAKEAETQAQNKLDTANKKLDEAKQELTQAEQEVTAAKEAKANALNAIEKADASQKEAVQACKDAQAQVDKTQTQFDQATQTYDTCNANYIEAENKMKDASGVISQCNEYSSKMKTLKDNLVKATKLQEKANKAAEKAEQKQDKSKDTSVPGSKPNVQQSTIDQQTIKLADIQNESDTNKLQEMRKQIQKKYTDPASMTSQDRQILNELNKKLGLPEE